MTQPLNESTPRRRGRPPGAQTRLLSQVDTLGLHHFAFLRACLQGVDKRWAWERYLAFAENRADLRHIEHRRKQWMTQVLRLGHQLNLSLPPERQITRLLSLLSREPVVAPVEVLPSLDEFIAHQGLDPDLYSEAELLALYEAHHHSEATDTSGAHVQALNQLAALLAVPPASTDPVARWLDARLADTIRLAGAPDLARLVDLVNVHGYRWYRRIRGLGEARAARVTAWLSAMEAHTGCRLRPAALVPPTRPGGARDPAASQVSEAPRFALVPLGQLLVPSALNGRQGLFRTGQPNTLGAQDDLEALHRWLARYTERPHTLRSYTREVERFYLWCLHERGKALSDIDAHDCLAYRAFLAQVPPHWCQCRRDGRPGDADWRPFRGPLSPSSQKLALVIVQTLFEGLRLSGYLVANPMAAVMKGFNLPAPRINVDRAFTVREWDHLMRCAAAEPPSPVQRRLLLLLELLVALGLRTDELAHARRSDLRRVPVQGEEDAWILVVTGKRRKQREVPVPEHVVALIEAHHADLGVGSLPSAALVLATRSRIGATTPTPMPGEMRTTDMVGAPPLSAAGIYATLKRFFHRAAHHGGTAGDHAFDPQRLHQASTHWLRHTFGRQAAADEVPVEVIQQALGHSSLATTTIYTSTERERMIRALRRRARRAGP